MAYLRRLGAKTGAAALAASLSLSVLFATAACRTPPKQEIAKPAAQLFASERTREALGWIAESMPRWAGMDVLLISGDDLGLTETERAAAARAPDYDPQAMNLLVSRLRKFAGDQSGMQPDNDFLSSQVRAYMLARSALSRQMATMPLGDKNRLCAITLPRLDAGALSHASSVSGVPEDKLAGIPGKPLEWLLISLAHEAAHCGMRANHIPSFSESLDGEIRADRSALAAYFAALAAGKAQEPAVPAVFAEMRALSAFNRADPTHATGIALRVDGGGTPDLNNSYNAEASVSALLDAYRKIIRRADPHAGEGVVTPYTADSLFGLMTTLARAPSSFFGTIAAMESEGRFRGDPVQQAYISRFLGAGRRHASAYFGAP